MSGPGADDPVRVLLTKSMVDSHDRAIKTIATALRDAGMEVVLVDYATPADIVRIALDEDVDVIGISFMSGGQVHVSRAVVAQLAAEGMAQVAVVVGGTIRPFDVEPITSAGVDAVFTAGASLASIAETVGALGRRRRVAPTS